MLSALLFPLLSAHPRTGVTNSACRTTSKLSSSRSETSSLSSASSCLLHYSSSTSSNSSLPISSSASSLYSHCQFFSNRTFVNRKQTLPGACRPSSFLDLFDPGLALFSSSVSHLLTCIPSHSYCLCITEKFPYPT